MQKNGVLFFLDPKFGAAHDRQLPVDQSACRSRVLDAWLLSPPPRMRLLMEATIPLALGDSLGLIPPRLLLVVLCAIKGHVQRPCPPEGFSFREGRQRGMREESSTNAATGR